MYRRRQNVPGNADKILDSEEYDFRYNRGLNHLIREEIIYCFYLHYSFWQELEHYLVGCQYKNAIHCCKTTKKSYKAFQLSDYQHIHPRFIKTITFSKNK